MFMLFLAIIVLGLYLIKRTNSAGLVSKHCEKVHKWVLRFDGGDKRGYLICKECGKLPGED